MGSGSLDQSTGASGGGTALRPRIRVSAAWVRARSRASRIFWTASGLTICREGREETIDLPITGNGFEYEAQEVMKLLREGKTAHVSAKSD